MDGCILKAKKYLIVLLSAFLLTSCGNSEASVESAQSKSDVSNESTSEEVSEEVVKDDEIKLPYNSIRGNFVWDLKIFEDCLYIGAGNYDKNYTVGVTYRYNFALKKWEQSGVVPDEQISRFLVIDNKLMVPGIDPTGSWDLGNYYVLENGKFVTKREIPGGIHCFDIAKYEDEYYFGVGVSGESTPVLVLDKESGEYVQIPVKDKKGETVDMMTYDESVIRAYDLIVLNDTLYALITLGDDSSFYKIENSEFVYCSNYSNKLMSYHLAFVPIVEKTVYNDSLYFTNGLLYQTNDMISFEDKTPKDVKFVIDLLAKDDRFFLLGCTLKKDGTYIVKILEMKDDAFTTISEFESEYIPMSFECDGTNFYVANGDMEAISKVDNCIKIIPMGK